MNFCRSNNIKLNSKLKEIKMRKCKIGIEGFGTVGSGIYKILTSELDSHPILKEIEISKIAVKDLNKKRDIELDNNWRNVPCIGVLTSNCVSTIPLTRAKWDIPLSGFITEKEIFV